MTIPLQTIIINFIIYNLYKKREKKSIGFLVLSVWIRPYQTHKLSSFLLPLPFTLRMTSFFFFNLFHFSPQNLLISHFPPTHYGGFRKYLKFGGPLSLLSMIQLQANQTTEK